MQTQLRIGFRWALFVAIASAWACLAGLGSRASGQGFAGAAFNRDLPTKAMQTTVTLLDFTMSDCPPCRAMAPIIANVQARGFAVQELDRDRNADVVAYFKIVQYPTYIAIRGGQEVGRIVGATKEADLLRLLSPAVTPQKTARSQFRIRGGAFSPQFLARAEQVANEQRRKLAIEWFGHDLPDWDEPCEVELQRANNSGGGETHIYYVEGRPRHMEGRWEGTEENLIAAVIPHEVYHAVAASYYGRPQARWCNEGAAMYVEGRSDGSSAHHQALMTALRTGRAYPTKELITATKYPTTGQEISVWYGQAGSISRFLIEHNGPRGFTAFMSDVMAGSTYEQAIAKHFGIASLDDLQTSWLEWVRAGSPAPPGANTVAFRGQQGCFRWRPLKRVWERIQARQQARHASQQAPQQQQRPAQQVAPIQQPQVEVPQTVLTDVPPSANTNDGWRPVADDGTATIPGAVNTTPGPVASTSDPGGYDTQAPAWNGPSPNVTVTAQPATHAQPQPQQTADTNPERPSPNRPLVDRVEHKVEAVATKAATSWIEGLLISVGIGSGPAGLVAGVGGALAVNFISKKAKGWWANRKPGLPHLPGSIPTMPNLPHIVSLAPADSALAQELQSLRDKLAAVQQPVIYASPPIGDNLPRMRDAMKRASDSRPEARKWVKFFEETYKQILGGETNGTSATETKSA